MRLPLFLLHTVLVPGQRLPLKVFEARYLDMVSERLRNEQPFGVCLLRSGHEVGAAGEPCPVGTLAHIEQWEMPQPGVLHILVRGGERFNIRASERHGELVVAETETWPADHRLEIPDRYRPLVVFLQEVRAKSKEGDNGADYGDAAWVSWRLAELLPVINETRQRWLETRDPVMRLSDILDTLSRLAEGLDE